MEILKDDFVDSLPKIREALMDADFISVDAEFSGLATPDVRFSNTDDAQYRYNKVKQHIQAYMIVQYGVCAFKKTDTGYVAKPFNFYVFGGDTDTVSSNRNFLSNASSLSFLRSNNFDFNKLIDQGIPFYNHSEESGQYTTSGGRDIISRHSVLDQLTLNKANKGFLEHLRLNLASWLQNGTTKPLLVSPNNVSQRKIVYQELQNGPYGGYLKATSRDTKHMEIVRVPDEQRFVKTTKSPQLNFRHVIEAIKDANCPVVIHNGMYDICHTVDQFWEYLPDQVLDFKSLVNDMWANLVDTKYMAEFHPILRNSFNSSVLGTLFETVEEEFKKGGHVIRMGENFDRYSVNGSPESCHEAGYDAYMTGVIYLGFIHFIKQKEEENGVTSDSGTEDDSGSIFMNASVTPYYNRIFLMRCDIPYIDLQGKETAVGNVQKNRFFLTNIPSGMTHHGIEKLYPDIQPINVSWHHDGTAWITVKHTDKIDLVKLGMLGKEAVREFTHGTRKEEGTECRITSQAANMELLSGEQWEVLEQSKTAKLDKDTKQPLSTVPTGGSSYDDLDIPLPPSFTAGKRERSPSAEEKDAKKTKN